MPSDRRTALDKNIRKINDILVNLFNMVLKMEEEAIRETSSQDLSITEVHTLVAIGKGRPRTMTHVANILGISVSTLTTAVGKLVKKGYVERVRDEEDRRIVRIHLTESGVEAVNAHENFHDMMISEAVSEIPEDELGNFISSIDNINQFLIMRSMSSRSRQGAFTMKALKLGTHELPVPIVQAGMGLGIAGSRLAAAVAAEGGLGLIGTADIGFMSELYTTDKTEANIKVMEQEIKNAFDILRKSKSKKKGLIGVGIMWDRPEAYRYAEAAIRAGAQVIVTSAAIPTDLPKYCGNKKVALIPTISSKRAASAIIRTWTRKYNRVPDGFIFQGSMAAGMLGFKEAQLDKAAQEHYRIIADIKSELSKLENCPLIASGGIFNKEDAEKAYMAGADGFLMGTRFVTTEECGAPDSYKNLYLNCTANDVTIVKSPMKTSVRVMNNAFARELAAGGSDDYDIVDAVRYGLDDHEDGLVFCNADAGKLTAIDTVKDVFREFTE